MQVVKDKEGRVTPTEVDAIDGFIPEVKDTPERLKEKRAGLSQFIAQKFNYPTLRELGITNRPLDKKLVDEAAPVLK